MERDVNADTPLLSVIVPCLNAEEHLARQLEALASQAVSFPWEIIFVDNRSVDDSVRIAETFRDQIPLTVAFASDRCSQPYAQNVGVKFALAEKLVFINADDEVAPGFLAAMFAALQAHDFVTSPRDFVSLNPPWVQHAHDVTESTHGALPPFAFGSAFGVSRRVLESVGGCPEEYGPVWDLALSIRLQLAGVTLISLPNPLVRYRGRTSICDLFRQTRTWAYYQPLVYREFGPGIVPPRPLRLALSEWFTAFAKLIGARSKADLAQCAVRFGYSTGRLHGSWRHRVLFL